MRLKKAGRPPSLVHVNFAILKQTRDGLNEMKRVTGLSSQAEVLDHLVAHVMSQKPTGRKTRADKGIKRGPRRAERTA
jgi:hypothetical protein